MSVKISLPAEGVKYFSEAAAPQFEIPSLFYHRFFEVLKAALHETTAEQYHLSPYQEFWKPSPNANSEHLFSELYTSDSFVNEHEKIWTQLHEGGCELKTVVMAVMLWSD